MAQDFKHRALLRFIKKIVEVPAGHSKEDLMIFRSVASRDYPVFVPLMDAYLRLAENSSTDVDQRTSTGVKRAAVTDKEARAMHLFDMLRDKKLFPSNSDLSEFAGRILPGMSRSRFEKVSRADIAARIIEYLETKELRTREELEASMRTAMLSSGPATATNRKSFLSEWENIIKGVQL